MPPPPPACRRRPRRRRFPRIFLHKGAGGRLAGVPRRIPRGRVALGCLQEIVAVTAEGGAAPAGMLRVDAALSCEDMLLELFGQEAMAKFTPQDNGPIPWVQILEYGRDVFHRTRLPCDLRVKWRNMKKKVGS